jgi:glycosyltransferase involved in cell wall biosynthesis
VPGDLTTPTGGYAYDRRMIAELRAMGWRVDVLDLGEEFPHASARARQSAVTLLAALPASAPVVVDGLAYGTLGDAAMALAASHRLIALVHHPLALETGLSPQARAALRVSERDALAAARRVIVTSATTARLLTADYAVPAERLTVVPPGNDRRMDGGRPRPNVPQSAVGLLAVGAVVPRKGYDVLIAALAQLRDLPWRLAIIGDLARDPHTAARSKADIARFGLEDRITLAGVVTEERLAAFYAGADIFTLASHFEGYGMAFAEAIACGLPVVATDGGATAETVPADARILVPTGDVAALADALRRLIEDSVLRQHLAAGARAAAGQLPTWGRSAELFARVLAATA